MPADPQKFKTEAAPGRMKHSFTAIRRSFPNVALHAVIGQIFLYRLELCKRPEFHATVPWNDQCVTFVHNCLTAIGQEIDQITYRGGKVALSLAERNAAIQAFVDRASDPTSSIESLAEATDAQHADQFFQPVEFRANTIAIDLSGEDADYPQPTPSRFRNVAGRQTILGIDHLVVAMTRSQSADLTRYVNEHEAAMFKARLAELYQLASLRGGNDRQPFVPTSLNRSELDTVYNADGSLDPDLHDAVPPVDDAEIDVSGLGGPSKR